MRYIGPDYNEGTGIVLPGLDEPLDPKHMSDTQINQLIAYFPHLSPYFDGGANENPPNGQQSDLLPLSKFVVIDSLQNINSYQSNQVVAIGRTYQTNDTTPVRFFIGIANNQLREIHSTTENADKTFTYLQTVSSSTWDCLHYLGKRATIEVRDSSGRHVIGFSREDLDNNNRTILTFGFSFSGRAYFN